MRPENQSEHTPKSLCQCCRFSDLLSMTPYLALLCKCCRFSDLLSMTPYLALARSAPAPSPPPRPGEADVSSDRLSSIVGPEPKSASQQFR